MDSPSQGPERKEAEAVMPPPEAPPTSREPVARPRQLSVADLRARVPEAPSTEFQPAPLVMPQADWEWLAPEPPRQSIVNDKAMTGALVGGVGAVLFGMSLSFDGSFLLSFGMFLVGLFAGIGANAVGGQGPKMGLICIGIALPLMLLLRLVGFGMSVEEQRNGYVEYLLHERARELGLMPHMGYQPLAPYEQFERMQSAPLETQRDFVRQHAQVSSILYISDEEVRDYLRDVGLEMKAEKEWRYGDILEFRESATALEIFLLTFSRWDVIFVALGLMSAYIIGGVKYEA